jgi:CheY-like chemotaxis protein
LELLETGSRSDIVGEDYHMAGMNGFEREQPIKGSDPGLPIALATGYAELTPIDGVRASSKPYRANAPAAAVEKAVNS